MLEFRAVILPLKAGQNKESKRTPTVDRRLCLVCGCCVGGCPANAMTLTDTRLVIEAALCTSCERCIDLCPAGALSILRTAGEE